MTSETVPVRAKPGVTVYCGGAPHGWKPGSVVHLPASHAAAHIAAGNVEAVSAPAPGAPVAAPAGDATAES